MLGCSLRIYIDRLTVYVFNTLMFKQSLNHQMNYVQIYFIYHVRYTPAIEFCTLFNKKRTTSHSVNSLMVARGWSVSIVMLTG